MTRQLAHSGLSCFHVFRIRKIRGVPNSVAVWYNGPIDGRALMATLYLSDLDGTLLQPDQTVSRFTIDTIGALVGQGMRFSYATARSVVTAGQVTKGLAVELPVIVHNGAFLRWPGTGEILSGHYLGEEGRQVVTELTDRGVYPLVYSMNHGAERFRYLPERMSEGMRRFLGTREGDPRATPVRSPEALLEGDIYYITCVEERKVLDRYHEAYRDRLRCILYREIYSGDMFLELMPKTASKAAAALELKDRLGCDRLVVFGDGRNDLDLFRVADEAYAVANADEEVKAAATAVIGSNREDGVARWLLDNVR